MLSTPSVSSSLNWIVQLYELTFFSMDELEGSYSPVPGAILRLTEFPMQVYLG